MSTDVYIDELDNDGNYVKCHGRLGYLSKSGIALAPVYGRLDGKPSRRGDTVNPVDGEVIQVQKCRKCGYSVSFEQNHSQR